MPSQLVADSSIKTWKEQVEDSTVPVVADFWAPWCGPCRTINTHINALAAKYQSRVKVVKVNVDTNEELVKRFGIMTVPTLIIFNRGKSLGSWFVGATPGDSFKGDFASLSQVLDKILQTEGVPL